ncbi:MAG: pyridoxamine 5'-phosphate oxidase family protein, partial [Nitrososphaeraceae archaeon]|nr:pyridoxamine 5'-phosphate oxidase family protein [Nitrososphaeraceae archaeon]
MVSEDMILECLTNSKIPIRLACMSISDWPIVVSLWYTYLNEKVYCATQNTAKVVKYLSKNPKCGFEIAGDSFPYRGVRGYGKASIVENKGEHLSLEEISSRINVSTRTLSKLWSLNECVDQKTIKLCFSAFNLELHSEDYSIVNKANDSETPELSSIAN